MSSLATLKQTPLGPWHEQHGGRMVDFAGWSMPVQYGSIVEEHLATRQAIGLFDVSHMGRLVVEGPGAEAWLDSLLTRRVTGTPVGRVRYSLVCNEKGGVLDDILFTRVGVERFDLVANASNREKLLAWFDDHASDSAKLSDRTEATAMIAVQGPDAVDAVQSLADSDVAPMKYYHAGAGAVAGIACAVSRTGYTGEDGFELICDAPQAAPLWEALLEAGGNPCGLASRDTLRLEAGMPLYGHELDEQINPIEAGLSFAVDRAARDGAARRFVGSDSLPESPTRWRIGLQVDGKRAPREGYPVLAGGEPIGAVTSGAPSPTLGYPIAMAYVDRQVEPGAELEIDLRGKPAAATVAPLPFYKRS